MPGKKKSDHSSHSALLTIFINVVIPVVILDCCSHGSINPLDRLPDQKLWQIGPFWAMMLALLLPIGYGIRSLLIQKKFELMSAVGMAGVVLTGLITLFVIGPGGQIHNATPWLFAGKEALIPLILASAVIVSSRTETPLLKTFIYNPEIFDVPRIEKAIREHGETTAYDSLLNRSTWTLAVSLIISSAANFIFSYRFMAPVIKAPIDEQQVEYNLAISNITWWGFLIIGAPLLLALFYIIMNLVSKLGHMTRLSRDEILY